MAIKFLGKKSCQKWDSNPRLENQTATWTQRLRPLGHPDTISLLFMHIFSNPRLVKDYDPHRSWKMVLFHGYCQKNPIKRSSKRFSSMVEYFCSPKCKTYLVNMQHNHVNIRIIYIQTNRSYNWSNVHNTD